MGIESTAERCRRFVEAASNHDLDTLGALMAEDIVWHVGGNHALSGDYRGREALLRYFERVHELTGGTLRLEAEEIVADEQHAGAFVRTTMARNGQRMDVLLAELFRVGPDGTFAEFWASPNDQAAIDQFWAGVDNTEEATR